MRVKVRATGEHREHALVQVKYGVAAPTLVVKHGVRVDAHLARVRDRARARARVTWPKTTCLPLRCGVA